MTAIPAVNRLPVTAALAPIIVALLIGFLIRIVNDDPAGEQIKSGDAPTAAATVPAHPALPECKDTEDSLRERVETARHCDTDSDCTLFDFGYPIECMTSVAKSEITALRLEYRKYEQSCDFRVYYDCPAEPMQRRAVCHEQRCTVSLETIDTLRDETLEYLGIDESARRK